MVCDCQMPKGLAAPNTCTVLLLIYLSSFSCFANVNWFTLKSGMNRFLLKLESEVYVEVKGIFFHRNFCVG